MKLIDEQGNVKIFKWRINILDLLILMFIFFFMFPAIYVSFHLLEKRQPPPMSPLITTISREKLHYYERLESKVKHLIKEHKRLRGYFE